MFPLHLDFFTFSFVIKKPFYVMKAKVNEHFLCFGKRCIVLEFDTLRHLLFHFGRFHLPFPMTKTKTYICLLYGFGKNEGRGVNTFCFWYFTPGQNAGLFGFPGIGL